MEAQPWNYRSTAEARCGDCGRCLGHWVEITEVYDPNARQTFGGVLASDDYDITIIGDEVGILRPGTPMVRARVGDQFYVPNTTIRTKAVGAPIVLKPRVLHGNVIQKCRQCGAEQLITVCDDVPATTRVHR